MSNEFSYERYLAGEKVITRGGEEILYITRCDKLDCCPKPIGYVFKSSSGCIYQQICYTNGRQFRGGKQFEVEFDLIMAPKTMDLYIAVANRELSRAQGSFLSSNALTDKNRAESAAQDWVNYSKPMVAKITVNIDTWEQVL